MRLMACTCLLLLPLPAMAATICDDLATALKRGDGATQGTAAPSNILQALAKKSGGQIRIAEEISPVPAAYTVPDFNNPRMSRLDDDRAVAVADTQGAMHCQQWAFFEHRNGGVWRVKNPPAISNGNLCGDDFAQAADIGGVPAMVVEHDSDNRIVLELTPWQARAWGKSCRIEALFKQGHAAPSMVRVTPRK